MRSINTGLVALLPVGGLLFIGAGLLGAGSLKDLGLVLFVGMGLGVLSSILFAAPMLTVLKDQSRGSRRTPPGSWPGRPAPAPATSARGERGRTANATSSDEVPALPVPRRGPACGPPPSATTRAAVPATGQRRPEAPLTAHGQGRPATASVAGRRPV
jgi:preprotein translocase subunit SecF